MKISSLGPLLGWALCGGLLGCADKQGPANPPGSGPPTASAEAAKAAVVFDVPALVNLTADQVQAQLGKPLSDAQESDNDQMHTLRYRRRGYELYIRYEVRARRLLDLYLDPSHPTAKYQDLLQAANLTLEDWGYQIGFNSDDEGLCTSLSIRPDSARVMNELGQWVSSQPPAPAESAAPPGSAAESAAYVFDVPALLRLTADQVPARLGKPLSDEQTGFEGQKALHYRRRGYELSIGYDVRSRRLVDFYLGRPQPTAGKERLLKAAHLTLEDPRYQVEFKQILGDLYEHMVVTPDSTLALDDSGQ